MDNITEKIIAAGLTVEEYENCLDDIRSVSEHVSDLGWSGIVNKYGLNMHPDTIRKGAQASIFGSVFVSEYYKDKFKNQKYDTSKDLTLQKAEIQMERQKLFDEKRCLNKLYRDAARLENMTEIVKRAIDDYVKSPLPPSPTARSYFGNNDMIVHLTDIHYGLKVYNGFNKFDSDVLRQRLSNYLSNIKRIIEYDRPENCYLILGGDLINGFIHLETRLDNKENVIQQVIGVSDLISQFIEEIIPLVNYTYVYSVAGNHGRTNANKNEYHKGENFDILVPHYLKVYFKNYDNVEICDNVIDEYTASFKVKNKQIFAVHGDKDTVQTVVSNMRKFSCRLNIGNPDMIFMGHRHCNGMTTVDSVKVIESGCVNGMDEYCVDKRLIGYPEQMVVIVNESKSYNFYDINLED